MKNVVWREGLVKQVLCLAAALLLLGGAVTAGAQVTDIYAQAGFGVKGAWGSVDVMVYSYDDIGAGKVTSSATGCLEDPGQGNKCPKDAQRKINCDGSETAICSLYFPSQTKITLTATPLKGSDESPSVFGGWVADALDTVYGCYPLGTYSCYPAGGALVGAVFAKKETTVSLTVEPYFFNEPVEKSDSYISGPNGLKCGVNYTECTVNVAIGSTVSLKAVTSSSDWFFGYVSGFKTCNYMFGGSCSFPATVTCLSAAGSTSARAEDLVASGAAKRKISAKGAGVSVALGSKGLGKVLFKGNKGIEK